MNIHRNYFKIAAMAVAMAAALPALADETTVTVAKGNHHFIYYRDHDIYFAPESRTYYWMDNGTWQSGPTLPSEDQRYISSGGVDIQLDTALPYERHDYVMTHYKNMPATRETTTTERTTSDNGVTTTTTTKHRYVYYGDHDIYFAPESKTYYWMANGTWRSGFELPPESQSYVRNGGITIELDTDRPYERHNWVIAHFKHHHDRYDLERHDDDR